MAMSRGKPLYQLVDDGFHALMSSKFDGGVEEERVRAVNAELQTLNLKTCIVDASTTGTFGEQTDQALAQAHTAICFCSPNYGQKTKSDYSSFAEVKYASNKHLNILPIQLCDTFPPAPIDTWPPPGGQKAGANQNDRVFAEDVIRIDGRGKQPRQIAIEITEYLRKQIEASKALTAGYSTAPAPVPYPAQQAEEKPADEALTPGYSTAPAPVPCPAQQAEEKPADEATRRKTQEYQWSERLKTLRREEEARRRDDFKECVEKPTVINYTGQWKGDKKHGHGVWEDTNGSRYEGQFNEGVQEGFGKYSSANGDIYEGQWRASAFNGEGERRWSDGDRYFGDVKENSMDGSGVYIFADGRRYEGEIKGGKRHGHGDYWNAVGEKETRVWQDTVHIQDVKD